MTDVDPLLGRQPLPPPAATPVLSRSTPNPTRRPRRRHAAAGSRIATAGLGVATMFGLVASMGIASAVADDTATTPAATTPGATPPPTAATSPTAPSTVPSAAPSPSATLPSTSEATAAPVGTALAPVTLTARPDVRVITPTAAPAAAPAPALAATTRGSG